MTRRLFARIGLLPLIAAATMGVEAGPARAQFGDCPQSCIDFSANPCTTLPRRSETLGPGEDIGLSKGSYDLTLGRTYAEGTGSAIAGAAATVTAVDDFILSGPLNLSPVTIVVSLRLIGSYSTDPYGEGAAGGATLTCGGSTLDVYIVGSGVYGTNADTTLRIPLTIGLGESFQVTYEMRASAGASARGTSDGRLAFENVPGDVAVRSCQGYGQNGPVPVRSASWGAVKIRYR